MANVRYKQLEEDQSEDDEPTEWSEFDDAFLEHFIP